MFFLTFELYGTFIDRLHSSNAKPLHNSGNNTTSDEDRKDGWRSLIPIGAASKRMFMGFHQVGLRQTPRIPFP